MTRLTALLLLLLPSFAKAAEPVRYVNGYGVLQPGDRQYQLTDATLRNPRVAFIVLRDRWKYLEPTDNHFDASYLLAQRKRAVAAGKSYVLAVMTGGGSTPAWIKGDRFRIKGESVLAPWAPDLAPQYLALQTWLANLEVAPGVKVKDDPALAEVWVSGPTIPSQEMNLNGLESARGYSSAKMLVAWKQSIDTIAQLYPGVSCVLSISGQPPVQKYQPDVIAYAKQKLGKRAVFQFNSLGPQTQHNYTSLVQLRTLHGQGYRVGAEMVQANSLAGLATFPERDFAVVYPPDVPHLENAP